MIQEKLAAKDNEINRLKQLLVSEEVSRDVEITGKRQRQVISISHSQGKMVNDNNSFEFGIPG